MSKIPTIAMIPSGYKANKLYSVLPTNGDADLATTRASTATRVNELGLIEDVATGVPRLDYTDGGCPSLLVEPASTNLITYSEDFSDASWIKGNSVINTNQAISPDGTLTASKLSDNNGGGSGEVLIFNQITAVAEQKYSVSSYLKADGSNWGYLQFTDYNGTIDGFCYFDLQNGLIGTSSNTDNQTIESVGNGWYRCSITITQGVGDTQFRAQVQVADADLDKNVNLDNTSSILIWGAQVEEQSYATSYIPTTGTTATRVAETVSKTGLSSYIGQSEGTIFIDGFFTADSSIFHINNSFANQIIIGKLSNGVIRVVIYNSSTSTTLNSLNTFINYNDALKIAIKYKNGDSKLYINGIEETVDTSTITFDDVLENIYLSQNYFFSSEKSEFKDLRIYNQALTDAELTTLTTL